MEDDNIEDISSQPYFVRAEFPFVFIPATSTTGFTFTNSHTRVIDADDQTTSEEFLNEKEKNEEGEEIIDDVVDQNEENDDAGNSIEQKTELRISQPKYSQLLKDLDFSQTRMVDVTNLLADDAGNYTTPDENENEKKLSGDEKYQSLSSASSDEAVAHQSSTNSEMLTNTPNETLNDLNNLANIIQEASIIQTDVQRKEEEDDNTSKQATQNYDLNDNEQQEIPTSSSKSSKNLRFSTQSSTNIQDDNLSSIPRLNPNSNNYTETIEQTQEYPLTWENLVNGTDAFIHSPTILIFSQPIEEIHTTPIKEHQSLSSPRDKSKQDSSSKQKIHHRIRQISTSSDADSAVEYELKRSKQKQYSTSQPQLSVDEDLSDLNNHLKHDRPYTTASDILLQRLDKTTPTKKKSHQHRSSTNNDTWMTMLEKLEREHKERLEKQQKQYEDYMRELEDNMKRRFDQYLSTSNSLQESKSETLDDSKHLHPTQNSIPNDRYRTYSNNYQYRPLAKECHSIITDKRQTNGTNLSRSQSREDISTLRTELSAKHAKHISDLKLYYEHELDELKNQLNRSKMGHSSSSTRQSIETIERINNENIRLHDEMKDIRHSLKIIEEENHSFKRQIEDLREQLNNKDLELKNYHRSISNLEQQLTEAHNIKERQDEKFRHADRQALIYQEENEKIITDLNQTRERLLRAEERCRELENENKTYRQSGFTHENNNNNNNNRVPDDHKFNSTVSLNMPTSREYGRFTLTTSKYSSSTITTPRESNLDSGRYTMNGSDDLFRHDTSPRPLTRITDYINEKPAFPQAYVPPSRPLYSPRKSSPNHNRTDQMPVRDFIDNHIKQSEQLEEKFDELLKKKRDLESRMNRIPTRGLTSTDRQLLEVLEREIERVEQQISSVKLELRKMNILRTH